jgi:hypothetical protein
VGCSLGQPKKRKDGGKVSGLAGLLGRQRRASGWGKGKRVRE